MSSKITSTDIETTAFLILTKNPTASYRQEILGAAIQDRFRLFNISNCLGKTNNQPSNQMFIS
jgi:hypothetical protein